MSEKRLKVGDIVVLKSGGPNMTVNWVDYDSYSANLCRCVWFDKSNGFHREEMNVESVEVVNG